MAVFSTTFFTKSLSADEPNFSELPYQIKIYVAESPVRPEVEQIRFSQTVRDRCRSLVDCFWELSFEFIPISATEDIRTSFQDPPEDWTACDKIFLAEFEQFGQRLTACEFDVVTRWQGKSLTFEISNPDKTVDVFVDALFRLFSPIAKLEKSSPTTATLRIRGANIFRNSDYVDSFGLAGNPEKIKRTNRNMIGGISPETSVLIPFVRSLDRDDRTTNVSRIPWTALVAESVDPLSNLLRCRIESSLRNVLETRRRGQTEVYALSVSTPMEPTVLRLHPRKQSAEKTDSEIIDRILAVYDVSEMIPGEDKPRSLGKTHSDGTFIVPPHPNRPVRNCYMKRGRSVVARIPVVRGLETEISVPISDDSIRLEAEAIVLGIREEMIDVRALRSILELRLKRFEEKGDEPMIRATRNELARLKDARRFQIELDQARLRFHSEDPVIQRQIDRLFRDTEKAINF